MFSHPCILSLEPSDADVLAFALGQIRLCFSFRRVILGKEGGGRASHVKQRLLGLLSLSQVNMRLNLAILGFSEESEDLTCRRSSRSCSTCPVLTLTKCCLQDCCRV